ncbi:MULTISPECIES: PIN domain-containing protein [Methylocaldum]|uniref:hypothetical protein n=1 Tax=unclassified Methylocaldum TaxID=2622260 RepID=UPI001B7137C3|nr:hypothetical protein [Methylocaldum sp. RMAD-M]MBP1151945.1 hypothetical protein [Methylocaldum sp. RMAD-M]MDV3242028.1 hypothetical protein [Methylocaldum sp.]
MRSDPGVPSFNGIDTPQTAILDELLGVEPLAIGDLIQPRSCKDFARMAFPNG